MGAEKVLLLGATGYIGGSILTALLALPSPPAHITFLVRDPHKAALLEQISVPRGTVVKALIGSLAEKKDAEMIARAAEESGVVINAATSDVVEWLQPVFEGIQRGKERRERAGEGGKTIFIHTSGTGMFHDDARGMYATDKIYTDYDRPDSSYLSISSLAPTVRHRALNLHVIEQEERGICRVYIVVPSHIWGRGQGEVFDKGISHPTTISFPWLVEESLKAGQAMITGKGVLIFILFLTFFPIFALRESNIRVVQTTLTPGLNRWDQVHITDTASLYGLVYSGALTDTLSHGSEGYYLGCAGDYNILDISSAIAEEMVELGLAETTEMREFGEEDDRYRVIFTGTNARGVAERSFSIGWKPKYDKLKDLRDYIEEEVRAMAKDRKR